MPQKTFTAQWLERLPLPEARTEFFDQKVTGLGLRVNLTGLKSWFFMYRAKGDPRKRRLTLGRYPAITLADARDEPLPGVTWERYGACSPHTRG